LIADLIVPASLDGDFTVKAEILDPAGAILRAGRIGLNTKRVTVTKASGAALAT